MKESCPVNRPAAHKARKQQAYSAAAADRNAFWARTAENIDWIKPWTKVLEWEAPNARWFVNGKLNAATNCIDRHLNNGKKNKAAIIFEGEPGDTRVLTYQDLHREVSRLANVLLSLGVGKGDIVTLYLPMIPELPIAMLACARLGVPHSVVFGGFSAEALADRLRATKSKIVITADGGWRRGRVVPLKANTDTAVAKCPAVKKVVVVRRTGQPVAFLPPRDLWYHELMQDTVGSRIPATADAEDTLFVLYTSGTTGKPKGIVHTTGGYLVGTSFTHRFIFDLREDDIYWCTADIGWITGHSYVVYGPLAGGATTVLYEGAPDCPDPGRMWRIVEKYGVNVLYTAPTLIRSCMKWGEEWLAAAEIGSLRLLGSVGEPLNPEAWQWYHRCVGRGKCPIVDTWWQTETGMILASPVPGVTPATPGSVGIPLPGIELAILDDSGAPVPAGQEGYLTVKSPWPSMLRGIHGDEQRFRQQYWSRFPGVYFTGDGAKQDTDGCLWITGRVDDVIKVAGHRLSTAELESALVAHPAVAEAAVIGIKHQLKGQAVAAFVVRRDKADNPSNLPEELQAHIANIIGKIAQPETVVIVPELPKTRSGKIMRRLLQNLLEGNPPGDVSTLADPAVLGALQDSCREQGINC